MRDFAAHPRSGMEQRELTSSVLNSINQGKLTGGGSAETVANYRVILPRNIDLVTLFIFACTLGRNAQKPPLQEAAARREPYFCGAIAKISTLFGDSFMSPLFFDTKLPELSPATLLSRSTPFKALSWFIRKDLPVQYFAIGYS
jgi:hypothetical protein